ncbi:MAG TPA: fumarylacetoacetate hydrolase family protein [Candidatus Bathyarchaeia archaeon]|nr:fumarylacetoacetate hydrolase family protein [Candidatus Bathyarchaeia archaeon]
MKLTRFAVINSESYGVQVAKDRILDLRVLSETMKHPVPSSLEELTICSEEGLADVEHLIREASGQNKRKATLGLDRARLLAPFVTPPKIVCLGLNYRDHIAEQNAALPDDLVIFMKPRTAIIGPNDTIVKPNFVEKLDYEGELAIIIGKRGKNISLKDTKQHIFGYTCFNDVSARDIQFKDKQWTRGKGCDTFAPTGPCVTTADQIGDPDNLRIRTRVNGEVRQDSSTRNMVFSVTQIVHKLSLIMTLEPCDMIATGTPAGVGFAMKPKPRFLKSGDLVEIEIENVGTLRNRVVKAS